MFVAYFLALHVLSFCKQQFALFSAYKGRSHYAQTLVYTQLAMCLFQGK